MKLTTNEKAARAAILKQEIAQAGFAGIREYLRTTRGARMAGVAAAPRVEAHGDRIVVELDGAKMVWTFGVEA